jgi:archaellum component FlaC
MAKRRREIDVFSLSFMDCICCGFGAIILLFVLTKAGVGSPPVVIEPVEQEDLSGIIKELEKQLFEIRGETVVLNRELISKQEQLSDTKEKLARLLGDLSKIEGEFAASTDDATVQNKIEGQLAAALQELTEEMKRLLAQVPKPKNDVVGGIPVDSEYIVFIIDTSGSMQRNWPLVQRKITEALDLYPKVKGIQVMNDMGAYMFGQYAGKWIPDTPARRKVIISTLGTWRAFSNSSPVEGINAAIDEFYSKDHNISLYIFGDEFSGERMQPVIDTIERLNHSAKDERRVRIHGVGFPNVLGGATGRRFSTLMRAICDENGGTFVGLSGR